jgi:hypothetical protein
MVISITENGHTLLLPVWPSIWLSRFAHINVIKKKMLLHSLGLGTGLQIYEGRDDQFNRPGPMA